MMSDGPGSVRIENFDVVIMTAARGRKGEVPEAWAPISSRGPKC
jgi:hypothetical protein